MKSEPLLSIIIVKWNGRPFLEICLGSVSRLTYPRYEVVLVDNGSVDGSVRSVKDYHHGFQRRGLSGLPLLRWSLLSLAYRLVGDVGEFVGSRFALNSA